MGGACHSACPVMPELPPEALDILSTLGYFLNIYQLQETIGQIKYFLKKGVKQIYPVL
jgi:hypothetical protein